MASVSDTAAEFLSHQRIAVAGVSREGGAHSGNAVYMRLRERGYEVFAVNPKADEVEGDKCYRHLADIPGGVDTVIIATPPDAAESVARECHDLGITRVWMHRLFGGGSQSEAAVQYCQANGITAIAGGCPLMFGKTSDPGHRCMGWFQGLTGGRPRVVG